MMENGFPTPDTPLDIPRQRTLARQGKQPAHTFCPQVYEKKEISTTFAR